jgi:hypothetical protein
MTTIEKTADLQSALRRLWQRPRVARTPAGMERVETGERADRTEESLPVAAQIRCVHTNAARGDQSLRLDCADRLAAYFGLRLVAESHSMRKDLE